MLQLIKDTFTSEQLWEGNFGLEREMLRVTKSGELASTKHPSVFGSKLQHPFITTDFAENQIELITPTTKTIEGAHQFISSLYDIVANEINDELLWPQSMPANITKISAIKPAKVEETEGKSYTAYREHLLKTYGPFRQVICGIHYNFSFSDAFLQQLHIAMAPNIPYKLFKNEIYLKLVRNYMRYHWLIIYLLGYSPVRHDSYECDTECELANPNPKPISIRNSVCGYENKQHLTPDYYKVEDYCQDIEGYIQADTIKDAKEYYSSIRLKPKNPQNVLHSLRQEGIEYVEIRSLDLNPYEKSGIALDDLKFLHAFLLFALVKDEQIPYLAHEALYNKSIVSMYGLNDEVTLLCNEKQRSLFEWGTDILNQMLELDQTLGLNISEIIKQKRAMVLEKNPPAKQLREKLEKSDYVTFQLELAQSYKTESLNSSYQLVGFEDLELSTQILLRECLKQGIKFEILDRQDNFVKLQKGDKIEYVKQATKTSLDNYSSVLAMENKVVTKKILDVAQIVVPLGEVFTDKLTCKKAAYRFIHQGVVIKPNSTNFGLGITIFNEATTKESFDEAVDIAFKYDKTVIVESFVSGKEYRILVIGGDVVGVLHRVPANVIGDGTSSIEQLVALKNEHPWRGVGYVRPLEKIEIDASATLFLKAQHLTKTSIPLKDQIVYLRENSNISTGGDSIDFTDDLHDSYKEIAKQAAKAIGANICGVDMMIDTIEKPGAYAIIELNFNPAIHIHTFPYIGVSREPALHILKALKFIN